MSNTSDVSTVGKPKYERAALDFYPTPRDVTMSLLNTEAVALPSSTVVWEPCAGNGAIVNVLREQGYVVRTSDIKQYEGFVLDDTVSLYSLDAYPFSTGQHITLITNPPYEDSRDFIAHALSLANVDEWWFLLRHEWDAPAKSLPLVQHEHFMGKYVLKKRPRWIEGTTTAPRFPYAWYRWQRGYEGSPYLVYGI